MHNLKITKYNYFLSEVTTFHYRNPRQTKTTMLRNKGKQYSRYFNKTDYSIDEIDELYRNEESIFNWLDNLIYSFTVPYLNTSPEYETYLNLLSEFDQNNINCKIDLREILLMQLNLKNPKFIIPESCNIIDLTGSNVSEIIGGAKTMILSRCTELCNVFTIPKECNYINLSRSNISGFKGSAKEINLGSCEYLSDTIIIPKKCKKMILVYTDVKEIIGSSTKLDIKGCEYLKY